ncbi:MAG: hypothetical protein RR262_05340 [Clostridium sp.]
MVRILPKIQDITMLFSDIWNAQICQVVDPKRTARFVMPKWTLEAYEFNF